MFVPTEEAQRVVERALGQYLLWEGSDECLREKGRATPVVLEQEGLGERAVFGSSLLTGGTLWRGSFTPPRPSPSTGRETAPSLFAGKGRLIIAGVLPLIVYKVSRGMANSAGGTLL